MSLVAYLIVGSIKDVAFIPRLTIWSMVCDLALLTHSILGHIRVRETLI